LNVFAQQSDIACVLLLPTEVYSKQFIWLLNFCNKNTSLLFPSFWGFFVLFCFVFEELVAKVQRVVSLNWTF